MNMPNIHESAFVAEGAIVIGQTTLHKETSVWYHATIRADRATILIGEGSNVQDNAVVHVDDHYPVTIGQGVTIGHGAIVHGCSIGDNTVVGMGTIILNGAQIGCNCILGAGSLVTQNTIIPDNSLVIGSPAKVVRQVTTEEISANMKNARVYVKEATLTKNTV